MFTRQAWEGGIQQAIEKAANSRRDEIDWVLSDSHQAVSADLSPEALKARLTQRYFTDFAGSWLSFLNSLRLNPANNIADVTDQLTLMSDVRQSPLIALMKDEQTELLTLENEIGSRVVGQDVSLEAIAQRLRAAKTGLTSENGPQGVFLLVGPSGVGKTETALALADVLYGGEKSLITINHTKWAINHFSVDNQSGIDIIGPFQGGGGGCCYSVPARWTPGMAVRIDWETGVGDMDGFPGYQDREKYLAWARKMKAQNRQHSKTVPLPDYNGQDVCGITVHFLPCDDVKVTTSCWSPRNANYPIKEPIRMKEPKVCPG